MSSSWESWIDIHSDRPRKDVCQQFCTVLCFIYRSFLTKMSYSLNRYVTYYYVDWMVCLVGWLSRHCVTWLISQRVGKSALNFIIYQFYGCLLPTKRYLLQKVGKVTDSSHSLSSKLYNKGKLLWFGWNGWWCLLFILCPQRTIAKRITDIPVSLTSLNCQKYKKKCPSIHWFWGGLALQAYLLAGSCSRRIRGSLV